MMSSILTQFSLPPITPSMFLVAALTVITETREEAEEIVFIVPIRELKSGNFFITGATNLYFAHYLVDQTTAINYSLIEFFGYHLIQPFTAHLFSALNMLAFTIKKLIYYRTFPRQRIQRDPIRSSSQVMLFIFIVHKMRDLSAIKYCAPKNQHTIKY
jgi:hypothetical protein